MLRWQVSSGFFEYFLYSQFYISPSTDPLSVSLRLLALVRARGIRLRFYNATAATTASVASKIETRCSNENRRERERKMEGEDPQLSARLLFPFSSLFLSLYLFLTSVYRNHVCHHVSTFLPLECLYLFLFSFFFSFPSLLRIRLWTAWVPGKTFESQRPRTLSFLSLTPPPPSLLVSHVLPWQVKKQCKSHKNIQEYNDTNGVSTERS